MGLQFLSGFTAYSQDINLMRDWYIRNTRDAGKPLDVRIAYCDSLLQLPPGKGEMSDDDRVEILVLKAYLQQSLMHYKQSEQSYLQALQSLPKGGEKYLDVLLHTGVVNRAMGDFEGAIKYLRRIISMPKPDSLKYIDASAYSFLALVGMKHSRYDLAEKYLMRGDSLMEIVGNSGLSEHKRLKGISDLSCAKGLFYFEIGDFLNARKCLNVALDLSGDARSSSIVLVNLGLVYLEQGHEDVAEEYFKDAMNRMDSRLGVLLSVVDLLHIYIGQDRFDEARSLIAQYGGEIEDSSHRVILHAYYINRAIVEEHYQNYAEALKYRNLNDTLEYSGGSPSTVHKVQTLLNEIAQEEDNAARLKHNRILSGSWVIVMGICAALAALTILIIFLYYHKRHKRELLSARQQLSDLQREREELLSACEKISKDYGDSSLPITDLENTEDGERESFERKLILLHPDLTKNEIELSRYLLKNHSAKEIAELTHRSVRTIESVKYTLRKKLAVEETTSKYLHRIDAMSYGEVRRMLSNKDRS